VGIRIAGKLLLECKMMKTTEKLLVYSCSGCSNVAQLANDVAVVMDREGYAEMSCIAGVGGDVAPMVRLAQSGRPICAIDGCGFACVKNTLARHGVVPSWHIELTRLGMHKTYQESCTIPEHYQILKHVYQELGIIASA